MLRQQLSFTGDFFIEQRYDILSTRNTLPDIADISLPLLNLGKVNNRGYELSLGWKSKPVNNFSYNLTANLSFSRNKIIYMDEVTPNEPYMAQTGRRTGMSYGYIFDRYLTDNDFDPATKELSLRYEASISQMSARCLRSQLVIRDRETLFSKISTTTVRSTRMTTLGLATDSVRNMWQGS